MTLEEFCLLTFGSLEFMKEPPRLIYRAAQLKQRRAAADALERLHHAALADGLELGREYVPDPKDPPPKSKAHYKLTGYLDETRRLARIAEPERDWDGMEADERKRKADEGWARMRAAMGGK